MRDVINDVDPSNVLLLQEKDRLTLLLRKNRDQHVSTRNLSFARGLNVENCPLQYTLKTQRWLCFPTGFALGNQWGC